MFAGSVVVVQEVVPDYRLGLFRELATRSKGFVVASSGNFPNRGFHQVNFPRQEWGTGKPWQVSWLQGLPRWLSRQRPDIVVVPTNPRFLTAYSVRRFCSAHSVAMVGWGLGTMEVTSGVPSSIRRLGHVRQSRMYDGVIAYSSRAAVEYAHAGVDPKRITVAHNSKWSRQDVPAPRIPDPTKTGFEVAYLGRLIPTKAVDRLIRAITTIARANRNVSLIVIGDGPARLGLEKLVRELNAPVKFLGNLTGSALEAALSHADIAVLPGHGGLAMHDTMANSVPVLCGIGDGTQFDLLDGHCGWLLEDEQEDTLVAAIVTIMADPDELAVVRSAARQRITDEFNVERMADSFEVAYRNSMPSIDESP